MMPDKFSIGEFEFVNYIQLSQQDMIVIWQARNDDRIRVYMENPDKFSYEQHLIFIDRLKNRNDCKYYAIYKAQELIGSLNITSYDEKSKCAEIGKFLLPKYIGSGLGKVITKAFLNYCFDNGLLKLIYAKTLTTNIRNYTINMSLGYEVYRTDDKYIYMKLEKQNYVR